MTREWHRELWDLWQPPGGAAPSPRVRSVVEAAVAAGGDQPGASVAAWSVTVRNLLDQPLQDPLPTPERWREAALAAACVLGEPGPLAHVDALLKRLVTAQKARSRHGADTVEEAAQRLREKLLVGTGGGAPRLGQFVGRGPLEGFLRTALAREVASLARQRTRDVDLQEEDVAGPAGSAEVALLRRSHGPLAAQAFRDAFAALPENQRTLLQQVYAHGMTVDDLARLHGAHRATCARWVARARQDLGDATRRLLQERLGLGAQDADSVLHALQSSLSVSLGWAPPNTRSEP